MIRTARAKDIDSLMEITRACAIDMISKGIHQWNDHYPSKTAFINDLERNELYVLDANETVKGCIVISTHMDEEYKPIQWLTNNNNSIYVHRLAIEPSMQGKGYAQKLMEYAERLAKRQGFKSIRLDTFSKNQRNQRFYDLRGYQRIGNVYFPNQSVYPFYCYELLL
ncbi:MAG: GNAT family N-acetyltransferase [Bacteroidia bacterium]|nr:GNAT family N-acetyltransferase [Bacteroidia bacterium]NND11961.1 GNAT family N-acetyltransferase [Flavobacteriaceae bacterium]